VLNALHSFLHDLFSALRQVQSGQGQSADSDGGEDGGDHEHGDGPYGNLASNLQNLLQSLSNPSTSTSGDSAVSKLQQDFQALVSALTPPAPGATSSTSTTAGGAAAGTTSGGGSTTTATTGAIEQRRRLDLDHARDDRYLKRQRNLDLDHTCDDRYFERQRDRLAAGVPAGADPEPGRRVEPVDLHRHAARCSCAGDSLSSHRLFE